MTLPTAQITLDDVVVAIEVNRKILMLRKPKGKMWELPGRRVTEGNHTQRLIRCVYDYTGIDLTGQEFELVQERTVVLPTQAAHGRPSAIDYRLYRVILSRMPKIGNLHGYDKSGFYFPSETVRFDVQLEHGMLIKMAYNL